MIDAALIERVAKKIGLIIENQLDADTDEFKFAVVEFVNTHPAFTGLSTGTDFEFVLTTGVRRVISPDWFNCYLLAADALPEKTK